MAEQYHAGRNSSRMYSRYVLCDMLFLSLAHICSGRGRLVVARALNLQGGSKLLPFILV